MHFSTCKWMGIYIHGVTYDKLNLVRVTYVVYRWNLVVCKVNSGETPKNTIHRGFGMHAICMYAYGFQVICCAKGIIVG